MNKTRLSFAVFSFIAVFFFICGIAAADIIKLKNGRIIKGEIVREKEGSYIIDIGAGTVEHGKDEISSVERNAVVTSSEPEDKRKNPFLEKIISWFGGIGKKRNKRERPAVKEPGIIDYMTGAPQLDAYQKQMNIYRKKMMERERIMKEAVEDLENRE